MDALCRGGIAGRTTGSERRVHDTHLRQHAHGTGVQPTGHGRRTSTRSPTTHRSRAPWWRSSTSMTRSASSAYGDTGRVKLTTLTKEFFVPGFLERDEGEREPPYEVSVGRDQRRATVSRSRGADHGRRVLTSPGDTSNRAEHSTSLRWGQTLRIARTGRGRALQHGRADREGEPGQRRDHPARHAHAPTRPARSSARSRSTS